MTEAIIDDFKAVQIKEEHAEDVIRFTVTPLDTAGHAFREASAIGQACQGVVGRLTRESVLSFLTFCDIASNCLRTCHLSFVIEEELNVLAQPVDLTVTCNAT